MGVKVIGIGNSELEEQLLLLDCETILRLKLPSKDSQKIHSENHLLFFAIYFFAEYSEYYDQWIV